MKKFAIRNALRGVAVVLAAALPAAASAQSAQAPAAPPPSAGDVGAIVRHCLAILDLTDAQKTQISGYLQTQKPTVDALRASLQSDRETLRTDLQQESPDPCTVGADLLKVTADRTNLRSELQTIKAGIESYLSPDQASRFDGCLAGAVSIARGDAAVGAGR